METLGNKHMNLLAKADAIYRTGCMTGMTVDEAHEKWNQFVSAYNKASKIFGSDRIEEMMEHEAYKTYVSTLTNQIVQNR